MGVISLANLSKQGNLNWQSCAKYSYELNAERLSKPHILVEGSRVGVK